MPLSKGQGQQGELRLVERRLLVIPGGAEEIAVEAIRPQVVGAGNGPGGLLAAAGEEFVPAVAANVRECPQDEVFASGEKHRGVADAVGALHTGLRDVSATTDALPTGEEVRLLPFEDLGGRVCLGRKHPTRAERGEGPGDCCWVNRCDGTRAEHWRIL